MKAIKTLFQQIWTKGAMGIAVCSLAFCLLGFVSEAAEGTIIADTARIRAAADSNSEVIGSTTRGKVIDILEAVKDSSGTVWYKVPNGNNTYGYIRSDLVSTSDNISITQNSSGSSSTGNSSAPAATVPTSIGEMQATISQGNVRIRSGASTQHDTVVSLPQGTTITLIGEANDSAGNKWYQLTCNYNGRTVEGYVRSDLITIGGNAEGSEGNSENPEGENTEGEGGEGGMEAEPQEPVEPAHNDYEIVYDSGEGIYWLYNNTDSSNRTMVRVEDLLNVAEVANANTEAFQHKLQNERIVIIILAGIIVVLVIVITILLFKIRDLYYTDYEDYDEEEEEEEEEEPVVVKKKKKRTVIEEDEAEEPAPARKSRFSSQSGSTGREKSARRQMREENAELQAAERKPSAQRTSQRKPQNFLLDDDEFEFEFLNMDDKDL